MRMVSLSKRMRSVLPWASSLGLMARGGDITNLVSWSLSCMFSSKVRTTMLPLKLVALISGMDFMSTGGLRSLGPPVGVPGLAQLMAMIVRSAIEISEYKCDCFKVDVICRVLSYLFLSEKA